MICTIHQPNYLPYLGFFEKASNAGVLIIYDNTQYKTDDFQNRNKIRTKNGWQWLTVPVSHSFGDLIKDVKINNSVRWARKHWMAIQSSYSKAPFFKDYKDVFEEIYKKEWTNLSELNTALIGRLFESFKINTKIIIGSELLDLECKSTHALIDFCKAVSADTYIAGAGGKDYMDMELFDKAGIKVIFQDFKHPPYKQAYPGFEPYMCALDLLFNYGEESLKIMKGN
jgi:hypothetical protein